MEYRERKIDVIARFGSGGDIIPLRMRLADDSGEMQEYTLTGYRHLPDESTFSNEVFKVQFVDHNIVKTMKIYLSHRDLIWMIVPES